MLLGCLLLLLGPNGFSTDTLLVSPKTLVNCQKCLSSTNSHCEQSWALRVLCSRWRWWQPDRRRWNEICLQTGSEEHHRDLPASPQVESRLWANRQLGSEWNGEGHGFAEVRWILMVSHTNDVAMTEQMMAIAQAETNVFRCIAYIMLQQRPDEIWLNTHKTTKLIVGHVLLVAADWF